VLPLRHEGDHQSYCGDRWGNMDDDRPRQTTTPGVPPAPAEPQRIGYPKCNGPHEEPMQEKPEAEVTEEEARALFGDDERWPELGGWFRYGYRAGIEDERRRAAKEREDVAKEQAEACLTASRIGIATGRKAEREAVVRWLRAQQAHHSSGGGGPIEHARASLTSTYAEALERGDHLTPPEPTREQAEERVVRRMVKAVMCRRRDETGVAMGDDELDATLVQAQEMFFALPKAAQDAAIDAMLAEMRGEAGK
jgi:hypothetical protein